MRLSVALACVLLLLLGCAGPRSTGGLWAQQNLEREAAFFQLSDAQRAEQIRAFELVVADELLSAERSRLETSLPNCPGDRRQPLVISPGDRVRDGVRLRAIGDPVRLNALARVALGDWRLRRAQATGEMEFCEQARSALAGRSPVASRGDLVERLGTATVLRDPRLSTANQLDRDAPTSLSLYSSGYADAVSARAPLPQYLAAVYGGVVVGATPRPVDGRTPEILVDEFAPAYPEWEPDALYAALTLP
jgi:hypothetical protein